MTLENWMAERTLIRLEEKRNRQFAELVHAPNFNYARKELYSTLSRIETQKRWSVPTPTINLGIPLMA